MVGKDSAYVHRSGLISFFFFRLELCSWVRRNACFVSLFRKPPLFPVLCPFAVHTVIVFLRYVGADSQVTFLKSTSANVSFPTQIKWKVRTHAYTPPPNHCSPLCKQMQRINAKNGRSMRRSIRRPSLSTLTNSNTNSSDNPAARWQHYADRQWLDFDPGLNAKLEWAFRNDKACRFRRVSSSGQMSTYACDWARMKQVGTRSTYTRLR